MLRTLSSNGASGFIRSVIFQRTAFLPFTLYSIRQTFAARSDINVFTIFHSHRRCWIVVRPYNRIGSEIYKYIILFYFIIQNTSQRPGVWTSLHQQTPRAYLYDRENTCNIIHHYISCACKLNLTIYIKGVPKVFIIYLTHMPL